MINKLKIFPSQMINRNVILLVYCTQFLTGNLFAQKYQRHELIGAYVYNLTKNIQWENEENISEFHFLILSSDQKLIDEFQHLATTLTLRNKPIKVTVSETLPSSDQFHLIFLGTEKEKLLPGIFDKIEGENILLISDSFSDKRLIMINFIEKEDEKIQFEINKANIINQNLTIMPDILLLGGTEIDVAKLFRESQVSLRSMQKEMEKLGNNLNNLQRLMDDRNMEIARQQEIINTQAEEFRNQQKKLIDQREELLRLFQSVKNQQDILEHQKVILKLLEQELSGKSEQIQKSNEVLTSQRLTISEYTDSIKTQQKILEKQGGVISYQQYMIYVLGIITVLILILIITIYRGYKNKQKANKFLEEEITVRKNTENVLKERTKELARLNSELQAFSYSVSHDLRSPLRSIDGFSQILMEDYHNKLDKQGYDFLQRIHEASKHMANLIEDILNLSRIDRGEINIEQVNLSNIARLIANELQETNPERKVKFIIKGEIFAQADERLLRIVLENLIGNAWKYTSKHPTACIEFGMFHQDEKVVYFVRDDGAGFDMQYSQNLFGAFQRLHDSSEFPGTGIGLATMRRIIHRHGGTVWAEGEVEKGATIYFTIA